MTTSAALEPAGASVLPGEVATFTLTVANDSLLVESYTLSAVGPVAGWATVEPDQLTIYPGTSQTAVVTVAPPRASEAAVGRFAVGVRVLPTEQPDFAASAEADVEILPFSALDAELVPRISRGRGRKRVRLAVDDRGNIPLIAAIAGTSSDALSITTPTPDIQVEAGHALFVDVDLHPRTRVWRGADVNHPFTLTIVPQGPEGADAPEPRTLDGSYTQLRVFPRWLWKLLLALLLLLIALIALWFLVLKPAIEATAKEAIEGPVADASRRADAAAEQADQAAQNANEAKAAVGQPTEPVEPVAPGPTVTSDDIDLRLEVTDAPGGAPGESERFAVPENAVLRITDIVIQNPAAGFGTLTLENREVVAPILSTGLENFRDLDFHFVTPIEIVGDDELFAKLVCTQPGPAPIGGGPAPATCSASVLVSGVLLVTQG